MSTIPPSHQWNPPSATGGDEQRQRDRHVHGPGHRQVGIRSRPEVLEAVLLDVPDRRVGGYGQRGERHVAEQAPVRGLERVATQDAGEAAAHGRCDGEQASPVDVDVVRGVECEGECCDLVGGDARCDREAEQRGTGAQRDDRRPDPALLQCAGHPDQRCERSAAPRSRPARSDRPPGHGPGRARTRETDAVPGPIGPTAAAGPPARRRRGIRCRCARRRPRPDRGRERRSTGAPGRCRGRCRACLDCARGPRRGPGSSDPNPRRPTVRRRDGDAAQSASGHGAR